MRDRAKSYYWRFRYAWKRLCLYVDYVKLLNMKLLLPRSDGVVKLAGSTVHFGDLDQLTKLFHEIFIKRCYYCDLKNNPMIIDAGANIGLATLFFKSQYPGAKIKAFEPNPQAFAYLKKNIESNGVTDAEIHNVALGDEEGPITIYLSSDMARGDIGVSAIKQHVEYFHGGGTTSEMTVSCKKLSTFIDGELDLLKLDIEGSEAKVVRELGTRLTQIKNLVMEYHYHFTYSDNLLSQILSLMEASGHLYQLTGEKGSLLAKERTYVLRSKRV
jgi:FkbM family methyltransferase